MEGVVGVKTVRGPLLNQSNFRDGFVKTLYIPPGYISFLSYFSVGKF